MTVPTRPVLRWHGGKWRLAPWILSHFPPHQIYVEPYGGAASVLLRKERSYAEIYNDLDEEVVNLFRVLRDDTLAARLIELLQLTPFARAEFEISYRPTDEPLEKARRLVARSLMGFGSDGHNAAVKTGFRANSNRSNTTPAWDWASYPACLAATVERLARVVIEARPAIQVMSTHDAAGALHYVDPPYIPESRSQKSRRGKIRYHAYKFEMDAGDHADLVAFLQTLVGMVVLSGYPSALYDDALTDWRRVETAALADGAKKRTEVLWINPAAAEALDRVKRGDSTPLFAEAAVA